MPDRPEPEDLAMFYGPRLLAAASDAHFKWLLDGGPEPTVQLSEQEARQIADLLYYLSAYVKSSKERANV